MTREEAIYFANCLKNNYTVDLNDMEAFCDMAIKALEQEPTTKNNTIDFNKINELADFAIEATGQRDSYSQGMCNGIEYLRATLTDTEPKYFDSNDEYKESTTKNDLGVDCISRADARSLICKIDRKYMFNMSGKAFQDLYKGIDDLPSVTPQSRKGHWISRPHIYGVAFCSECGFELKINNTNYCPNCGAKMESEINNGNNDK